MNKTDTIRHMTKGMDVLQGGEHAWVEKEIRDMLPHLTLAHLNSVSGHIYDLRHAAKKAAESGYNGASGYRPLNENEKVIVRDDAE